MTAVSYQLYSSRNFPPLRDTIRMLADIGYKEVEGYGALFRDPGALVDLKDALSSTGLAMPTAHFDLDFAESAPKEVLDIAKDLNIETVVLPYLSDTERPTDIDGWRAFGRRLRGVGAPFREAGLTVAWHNHDFEFALSGDDLPLDLIFNEDDALLWEFDVAWAVVAGQAPYVWLDRYADRIIAVHIKDIAPENAAMDEDGWADVGHGTLDWPALMTAIRKTNARHFIVEHDNPADHERFAARSFASVTSKCGTA